MAYLDVGSEHGGIAALSRTQLKCLLRSSYDLGPALQDTERLGRLNRTVMSEGMFSRTPQIRGKTATSLQPKHHLFR